MVNMNIKQPDIRAMRNGFFHAYTSSSFNPTGHGHSIVKISNNEIPSFMGISDSSGGLESSEK